MKIVFAGGPLDGVVENWDDAPMAFVSTDHDETLERVVYERRRQLGTGVGTRPINMTLSLYVPTGTSDLDAEEMMQCALLNTAQEL